MKTVFFSWQSDVDSARNVISDALKICSKTLEKSAPFELDQATSREPGSPDIPETILKKIENCDIFICDVSIINSKQDDYRKTPNPNVLIELGYASKVLGWENIICLFNEDTGDKEELPFDIRHRRITSFSVKKMESKGAASRKLSADLAEFIKLMGTRLNNDIVVNFFCHKEGELKGTNIDLNAIQFDEITQDAIISMIDLNKLDVIKEKYNRGIFAGGGEREEWNIPKTLTSWQKKLVDAKIDKLSKDEKLKAGGFVVSSSGIDGLFNENYILDQVNYIRQKANITGSYFGVKNTSSKTCNHLKVEFIFPLDGTTQIITVDKFPPKGKVQGWAEPTPIPSSIFQTDRYESKVILSYACEILRNNEVLKIPEPIFFSPFKSEQYNFICKIHYDRVKPIEMTLTITFNVTRRRIAFEDIIDVD